VIKKPSKSSTRRKRQFRVRNKITGSSERPRLNVFRSSKHMYAQIIDDTAGKTLVSASTLDEEVKGGLESTANKEAAKKVGEIVAKRALDQGIEVVTFDRGGYLYHGRVRNLADGAREGGLKF